MWDRRKYRLEGVNAFLKKSLEFSRQVAGNLQGHLLGYGTISFHHARHIHDECALKLHDVVKESYLIDIVSFLKLFIASSLHIFDFCDARDDVCVPTQTK